MRRATIVGFLVGACGGGNPFLESAPADAAVAFDSVVRIDASVPRDTRTTPEATTVPGDGQVRLVGGASANAGALEIQYMGEWRRVCDDETTNVARVVCRQLGFTGGEVTEVTNGLNLYWLDDVICTGNEATLFECEHSPIGSDNCDENENIGITCTP